MSVELVLLEARARIAGARAEWLELELAAGLLGDDELDSRVAIARLAILDARDRLEQITDRQLAGEDTDTERTAA